MSVLKVFDSNSAEVIQTVDQHDVISDVLGKAGVRFEAWQSGVVLSPDADSQAVIGAYQSSVDALMNEYGFQSVDVISLTADHPDREALRAKFLSEHTHSDFEVRFFVEGSGLFYIHQGDTVFGVMCCAGDLISVPADCRHWFDMGPSPAFRCIRLFTTPEGWVAEYTGDDIADRFPRFDDF